MGRESEHAAAYWRTVMRVVGFVLVPVVLVGLLGLGLARTAGPKATVGAEPPNFELPVLGGERSISWRSLEGRPLVVNFWASWCLPCREEAPVLEQAWREHRERGVQFLGVNTHDAEQDAQRFVAEFGLTFPQARDVERRVADAFGLTGITETYFIDHHWRFSGVAAASIGSLRGTLVRGAISPATLRGGIEALLEKHARGTR